MSRKPYGRPLASPKRLSGAGDQTPAVRDIGAFLRIAYAQAEAAPLPDVFVDLLSRLGADEPTVEPPRDGLSDTEFKRQLGEVIPKLRIYARSICSGGDIADDLVQETLMKAWTARGRFQAGTNMRAWTYVILRNHYFSQLRRARFKGEWDDLTADALLAEPANQEAHVALSDVQRGMLQLPALQREALMLVGAGGMSYEEVAAICECPIGTIKSRVGRARAALVAMIEDGTMNPRDRTLLGSDLAIVDQIMSGVEALQRH
ncbi:MAG: RNA polymerase subunit sigma-70 [Alphaproteobacteria bacterium PA4]|nr:MAG: RNA polymerase subunit sigma-70 [Alphaproteobacteria bacterium PA4]